MPGRSPKFYVPRDAAPAIMEEIHLQAEAKRRKTARSYNPDLGATAEEAHEKLEAMRRDINAYGEYVYGLPPARHHRFWNQAVDDVIYRRVRQNKILIMAPPNSAKSTWNSLIRTTHYLGQNPNEQLLFMTSSDDMAKTFAGAVRTTLDQSERHREVFPDESARPNKRRGWSNEGLYLRGLDIGKKDPNYKAVGYTMTVMGARARGIILDDVLDQKQAESPAECTRAISYYDKTVVPRLDTLNGWLVAAMTRFSEGDLGGHFVKLAKQSGDWIILKSPLEAEDGDPMGRRKGESLWPEQFPSEFIKATKARMQIAEYNLVYQCLAGDVPISLTSLPRRFYRRWYEGPFIEIVTAGGKKLSGTPNHPVLTKQGWIPLEQLQEGDDVVCSPLVDVVLTGGDDVHHRLPTISEVFAAASVAREPELCPSTQQDFHGDGFDPKVEIIDVDSFLVDRLQTEFPEMFGQSLFGTFDQTAGALESLRPKLQLPDRFGLPIDDSMRGFKRVQVPAGSVSASAVMGGIAPIPQRLSPTFQLEANRSGADIVERPQFNQTGTPSVATDKIVQIVRDPSWAGHVYNLETENHEYSADGIITHNCDPTSMGGDIFTSEKYFKPFPENFWQEIAPYCFVGQAIDMAFSKEKRTAFTVILTFFVDRNYNLYIAHIERSRMNIVDCEERIYELARICKPRVVGIETENFHDKLIRGMVLRIMKRLMININLIKPDADKIKRARLPAGRAEHGFVYVDLDAPWAREFIAECMGFPNMRYKDQVDAFSLAALMVQDLDESALKAAEVRRPIPAQMVMSA